MRMLPASPPSPWSSSPASEDVRRLFLLARSSSSLSWSPWALLTRTRFVVVVVVPLALASAWRSFLDATAWRTGSSAPSSEASRDEGCTASMASFLTDVTVVERFRFGGISVGSPKASSGEQAAGQ